MRKRTVELIHRCPLGAVSIARFFILVVLLAQATHIALAQQPISGDSPPASIAPVHTTETGPPKEIEGQYRIGPGDVLDIRVFNKPQLSRDGVRVDSSGMIRMPIIEGNIQAACRTESELAQEVTRRYLDYVVHPQVDVFIKEYQSQQVAVLGAVHTPSRFQLQRRIRLLDLLSLVGGTSEKAGRSIQVLHASSTSICEETVQSAQGETVISDLDYFNLEETLRGDDKANPFVRPGDIVSIPEAEQVFVVGNVLRPLSIYLREPVTISRAIAMAGGTMPDTKSDRVRIIRQAAGSTVKTEIFVNLKSIDKHQSEDIALQANDIVDVPTSGGKRFLKSLLGGIAPSVSQLPIRVIP